MRITVQDPSAYVWTVERSWLPGLGSLGRRYARWYRKRSRETSAGDGLNLTDALDVDGDSVLGWIVGIVVVLLVGLVVIALGGWLLLPFALLGDVLVTLPLLVFVPLLRACGVVPFVVTARVGRDEPPLRWRVRGVRRSAAAARYLASILGTGDTPPETVDQLLRGVQDSPA